MTELESKIPERSPWLSLLLTFLTITIGFLIIGPLIGLLLALPFYDGTIFEFADSLTSGDLSQGIKLPLMIMQGLATLIGLLLLPLLYYRFIENKNISSLFGNPQLIPLALTAVAVISFMFPDSVIIEWNDNVKFPEQFHSALRETEDHAMDITRFLTTFDSTGEFLLGLIVIAILPALGEELSFRGMIQPALEKGIGNPHAAIWITAFLFSAFHLQFFGFVPRLLLGAFFGYLYYWSKSLWVPVTAHFVNNGLSVILVYLYQLGKTDFDAESTEAAPMIWVIPFTAIFILVLYYLKSYFNKHRDLVNPPV